MVYVYKKTIGNKGYYYLRVSERKGQKVMVKDVAYLGNSIEEAKKSLESLSKYKDRIRKAYKTIRNFIESNYYLEKILALKLKRDKFLLEKLNEIEACKLHYSTIFQKQDDATKDEIYKNFIIEFAFNTASIEGNTISLQEAKNLLQEGLTPKGKTLREIYDLQNTEKVFFKILDVKKDLKQGISHEFITQVHSGLMENIDSRKGYRTRDVIVIKAGFKATPAPYVFTDMNLLLKWYNQNKNKLHPFVLATIFHHKFEKIHPFMDGNGRTGRMLLNFILLRNGYPPIIIHKKSRNKYLDVLKKADNSGLTNFDKEDYQELAQFNANELIETYWNLFL